MKNMKGFYSTGRMVILTPLLWCCMVSVSFGQIGNQDSSSEEDAFFIKQIHNQILKDGNCYRWLYYLSEEVGGRLSGSKGSYEAVDYTASMLQDIGFESVYKQACMVTNWKRIKEAECFLVNDEEPDKNMPLQVTALGNSISTPSEGVTAEVVEVPHIDSIPLMGRAQLEGKIAFFNDPMDPTMIRTFHAYGAAVGQRYRGATLARQFGAVAAVVRSLTTRTDNNPHTGVTAYEAGGDNIPAIALSTRHADYLKHQLRQGPKKLHVKTYSENRPDTLGYNVVAEIRGSEFPDEIILVGGHLDSWDLAGGAHDDGAGCVHAMQVMETLIALEYKPKRTIRCVLFMNEENGGGGAKAYRDSSNNKGEFHLAALESDAGGFTPRGFSCDAEEGVFNDYFKKLNTWLPLLEPYGLSLSSGGSGADISPLKSQQGLLIGFRPDSQRYFDYHHAQNDRIDAVNERELKMGAAAITSLIYLIDKYGLD